MNVKVVHAEDHEGHDIAKKHEELRGVLIELELGVRETKGQTYVLHSTGDVLVGLGQVKLRVGRARMRGAGGYVWSSASR